MRHHPELWHGMPSGPFTSAEDLISNLFEAKIDSVPGNVLFSILMQPHDGDGEPKAEELAGIVGFLNSSVRDAVTEIGWVCHRRLVCF